MYLSHHRFSRAVILNASAGVLLLQLVGLDFDGNNGARITAFSRAYIVLSAEGSFSTRVRWKCRRSALTLSARQTAGRAAHPVGSRGGNIIRKAENAHGQAAFAGVRIYYDGEIRSAHMDAAPMYRARDLIIIIYLYESTHSLMVYGQKYIHVYVPYRLI